MNIGALLAGLLSGIIASMGMGGGAVLLIYLSAFLSLPQLFSQGVNLLFFIPIGVLSVIIYAFRGKIKFKTVLPLAAFGLMGSGIGLLITKFLSAAILTKLFALFLLVLGFIEIFKKDKNTP